MLIRNNPKIDLQELVIVLDNSVFALWPDELLLHLIRQVPHHSLAALRSTNKKFRALCDDYLFNEHNIGNIQWRIGFFSRKRDALYEDIEEEEEQRSSFCCSTFLLAVDGLLTYAGATNTDRFLSEIEATRSEQILFIIYALAVAALLIYTLARLFNYGRATYKIHAMYQQVEEIQHEIDLDTLRLPPAKPR